MHQLSEDGRFLTESLEDNVQHGCEEDVEQQRGQHACVWRFKKINGRRRGTREESFKEAPDSARVWR